MSGKQHGREDGEREIDGEEDADRRATHPRHHALARADDCDDEEGDDEREDDHAETAHPGRTDRLDDGDDTPPATIVRR